MNPSLTIHQAEETIFFTTHQERLRQCIQLTVDHTGNRALTARVVIEADTEPVVTFLEIQPGIHEYCCYAPVLWRKSPPLANARLQCITDHQQLETTTSVGNFRPWTLYVLADVCSDTTWVYADEETMRRDDADLTRTVLRTARQAEDQPTENQEHYNLVHCRQVEYFLERYPEQAEELFDAIRRGVITLNPFYNMCLTQCVSLEELLRQFSIAGRLAQQHNLPLLYANAQETPTLAWAAASLLASCGVEYLVKALLPYECPWVERYTEPPLFRWLAPDGKGVYLRRRNQDYIEAAFLLKGLRQTNTSLHEQIIPAYEALAERYPFDAIALLGVHGDLCADSWRQVAVKAHTIQQYNAQGWQYPRLVNASQAQFWQHITQQVAQEGLQLECTQGDTGTSWDAWPSSLAHLAAGWRQAQRQARQADLLLALHTPAAPAEDAALQSICQQAWMNLIYLSDHAWNGENEANRHLNTNLRQQWVSKAQQGFEQVSSTSLQRLAQRIPTNESPALLVFNSLGWQLSQCTPLPAGSQGNGWQDAESGQPAQTQTTTGGDVLLLAEQVPALGYRVYIPTARSSQSQPTWNWHPEPGVLDGAFYRLQIDPHSGALSSLWDKQRNLELVNSSHYHLNQAIYTSNGKTHRSRLEAWQPGDKGELFGELHVHTRFKGAQLVTTYRLHQTLNQLDITNRLEKEPASERQELDFAFPFALPGCQVRYEAPGVIIDPQRELLPGAGAAVIATRHLVDLFNQQCGVSFCQLDSYLVKFGEHPITADLSQVDPHDGLMFAVATQNCLDWHEAIRNQAGCRSFVFRYHLRNHDGGFDPTSALRFSESMQHSLGAVTLPPRQAGDLPAHQHSFLSVSPATVHLTVLKQADSAGVIVRLWEIAGQDTQVTLDVRGLGELSAAALTDPLERDQFPLPVQHNQVQFPIKARSFQSVRLQFNPIQ